ncbi:MAG: DNA translocase FtsK [Bacteroidales bacterium]|nr:DNA translocase FtsK [Bacteroidales bacterium]
MAKKKVEKKASTPSPTISKIKQFFGSEITHFITGLAFFVFDILLIVSYISFFYTGAIDQSKIDNKSLIDLMSVSNGIENWAGSIGAFLSDLFLNKSFGVSSIFIFYFLGVLSLRLMKATQSKLFKHFIISVSGLIWGSLFFGFFFVNSYISEFLYLGGVHGFYLSQLLQANVGWIGTCLLILGLFVLALIFINANTIPFLRKLFSLSFLAKKEKSEDELMAADNPEDSLAVEILDDAEHDTDLVDDDESEEDLTDDKPIVIENSDWISSGEEEDFVMPDPVDETPYLSKDVDEPDFIIEKTPVENEEWDGSTMAAYDPTLDLSSYKYPTVDLLRKYDNADLPINMEEQSANKNRIIETLENYGIKISSIKATVGPTITLYEIVPEAGVRISKIRNLEDDIALSLAALGIRIIAPIPGKGTIGIEVPNKDPQIVSMQSIIASRKFQESKFDLPIAIGKTITNEIFMVDLCKMPHILVAGATGQGKSVGLNAIITSLLYKKHPSQLKFVLVDPKKVEFNIYSNIERHFLAKLPDGEEAIITDVTKVVNTLKSITIEMDNRYDLLQKAHVRNIKEYNDKFINRKLNPEKGHRFMPYIVVIIDEFGDLIMTAGKDVELPIARIAQLARAVGIHMIIATQRPSTNIITGTIKANFPARVAFRVSSMIDSRTILDTPGANQLIGRGDLLFSQGSDLMRVQCAFVDTPEVEEIADYIGNQKGYPNAYYLPEYVGDESAKTLSGVDLNDRDPLFEEAARIVVMQQQGSTSLIQRKMSLGYNRAGRIMDQLEAAGIVGAFEGSKARQVLMDDEVQLEHHLKNIL